jgi:hypothetical protein
MGIIGKDFSFKKIVNFLTKEEINLLKDYCEIKHITNKNDFDMFQVPTKDTSIYGDPIMESLMLNKKTLMEKLTGKNLLATYSFWRMYTKFAPLHVHRDRESCEISVTVHIGGDGTSWPIFVDNNPIETKPGDAVIYLGCELEHYREPFQGDWQSQVFLHYVDKDGINKEHERDKRLYWGLPRFPKPPWIKE